MKTAKTILKIGLLGVVILIVLGLWNGKVKKANEHEFYCQLAYLDFKREIDAALEAEPVDKLAHLQAAQMNMQILYQKDCCQYEETCPGGIKL